MTLQIWMNGAFLPLEDARTGAFGHALHYGTGVFEGIRAYPTSSGPAVFRFREHLDRMQRGADLLGMTLDLDEIERVTLELLQRNDLDSAYVRPIAYYGAGGLALDLDPLTCFVAVATLPWTSHLANRAGVKLTVSPYRRLSHKALPPLKFTGTYANSCVAKREASRRGFDEALFIDDHGMVCEATGENVFFVKNGRITAVQHPDALAGITRATVMELAGSTSRPVHIEELLDADEIFLTGTSAEVARVGRLDDRLFGDGPITRQIAALYDEVVHGREHGHARWLTAA
jgi:branched-chain amino acid aminotransferase